MNYAVMPLANYDAVCDKVRERANLLGFEDTDFGFIRSFVFNLATSGTYRLKISVKDASKFSIHEVIYAGADWQNDNQPGSFDVIDNETASTNFPSNYSGRIFIGTNRGLKASDITSATLERNGQVVIDFSAPRIKSGEMADKVEDVYKAGQFDIMDSFEAFKGNAVGQVVSINDVSPIEHAVGVELSSDTITDFNGVKVSVGGANLLNMDRTAGTLTSGSANTEKREFEFDKFYVGYNRANFFAPHYATATLQDGVFTITATGYYGVGIPFEVKPNTQYVFSGEVTNEPYCTFTYYDKDGNYLSAVGEIANGVTTPPNATVAVLCIAPTDSRTVTATNLQIEYGDTSSIYEPYIEPIEYTANADGTVEGVKSRYPSMSFSTDAEGVIISVNYYRDIDKVINGITTAVALSGGE
jgi:hypothetical protein